VVGYLLIDKNSDEEIDMKSLTLTAKNIIA